MLNFPIKTSELRDLFDVSDLVSWRTLPTFPQALRGARATVAGDPAIAAVNSICLRANGDVWLIKVGPRGGWRRLWNFGNPSN